MSVLTVTILDDEQPAIDLLSLYVTKTDFLTLQFATTNALDALQKLTQQPPDVLFLDIEMPDINGVELLSKLANPPMVIFTTAYEQYAIKGYELNVIDYLLKPFSYNRFLQGANKALHQHKLLHPTTEHFITIKANYKTIKLNTAHIIYIEGLKDYVKIYTLETMYMTRLNLKGIQSQLPDDFIRIHKSFIVSKNHITSYQKNNVFIGEKVIPVGESYKNNLANLL